MTVSVRLMLVVAVAIHLLVLVKKSSQISRSPYVDDEYRTVRDRGPGARTKKLLNNPEKLWPKAAVIFRIDDDLNCPGSKICRTIIRAMKAWSDKTCIRFKQRSGEHDWVRIFHNETQFGCSADNGRQGGEQELSCGPGQWHHRILMHELGHVLTLKHDHQRPDRDKYVKVIDQNIKPGFENQFEIKDRSEFNILGLPYDRHSVMAYGASTFSKDGEKKTLKPTKLLGGGTLKRAEKISEGDAMKITDLYRCTGPQQKTSWPVDVFCDFKDDDCGFDWFRQGTWKWVPESEKGGHLISSSPSYRKPLPKRGNIYSINFHGLSPFDRDRGPMGCISFEYSFQYTTNGEISLSRIFRGLLSTTTPRKVGKSTPKGDICKYFLQLASGQRNGLSPTRSTFDLNSFHLIFNEVENFQLKDLLLKVDVDTPFDIRYKSHRLQNVRIWSHNDKNPNPAKYIRWYQDSVPANVQGPFRLEFYTSFGQRMKGDQGGERIVIIKNLAVKYSKCGGPGAEIYQERNPPPVFVQQRERGYDGSQPWFKLRSLGKSLNWLKVPSVSKSPSERFSRAVSPQSSFNSHV
ncbi:unnamed protein product [Bemisia tabaci]|uniref:Metalloendopeptidase n=1 Tax=Bemisia tabaci TaxID=7038 RepID=A0A9N9ZZE5_BEMTA|nr:unnamed protein product [Bemisia tabaci]